MARYWGMRTDRNWTELLAQELEAGRLRQGWGYDDSLDLRLLRERRAQGELEDTEADVWKRNRRLLVGDPDAIEIGDRIVLPHLPDAGRWTIVEVTGDYDFDRLQETDDHGHIVAARVLQRGVSPRNALVPSRLRGSMKYQGRFWSLDRFGAAIEALVGDSEPGAESSELARMLAVRKSAEDALYERLTDRYVDADFERPIGALLEAMFGVPVEARGGPAEAGADLLCRYADPLGTTHVLAVQVKMWVGTNDDGLCHALDQIEQAYENYEGVTSGVVISLVDEYGDAVQQRCDAMSSQEGLGIPVRVMGREDLVPLLLRYLPQLTEAA